LRNRLKPKHAPASALSETECASLFRDLKTENTVALAVSGGADSVALMCLAGRWAKSQPRPPALHVLTVDHGLRADSAEEAKTVANWARQLGLAHEILVWTGDKPASNIQAEARAARYDLMITACRQAGAKMLVTAHHLEDQAETLLLRLARGSGVDGLSAMDTRIRMSDIDLLRPFLGVPRTRLRASLEAAGHSWIEDPSNQNERFARIRFRKLQPQLDRLGMTSARLAATAQRMQAARQVLEAAADRLAREALIHDPAGYCHIDRDRLTQALPETTLRLLGRCLTTIGGQAHRPRQERMEGLLEAILDGKGCRRTLSGCHIECRKGRVWIWREAGRDGLPRLALRPGETIVWDNRYRIYDTDTRSNQGELIARALESEGWSQVRDRVDIAGIPAALGRTFLSIWDSNRLLSVPYLKGLDQLSGVEVDYLGRLHRSDTAADKGTR